MIVNLIKKCMNSKGKEFYYGALMNKEIKDVYMGYAYLDPKEIRSYGPGKDHEEIIMVLNGEMKLYHPDGEFILKKGNALFLKEGLKTKIENITNNRVFFCIAGGHPVPHSHNSH